jgi:hypothetical protein
MTRTLRIALLLSLQPALASTVLTVFTLSTKTNIDFTVAGTDQKVASFLVIDPALVSFNAVFSMANDCNVQHFRRSNLSIPITKIRISVNGGALQDLWTRSGSDCASSIIWTPPDPSPAAYQERYQVDVFISWDAHPMFIAGSYSETLNVNAYIP